jgi:hypothetical protein
MNMGFLSSFIEKTLDAVKTGKKLDEKEVKILEDVLEKRANTVRVASKAFATAILISSKDGETINRESIRRISVIFETVIDAAMKNSLDGKPAFTEPLRNKLVQVFNEVGFNGKVVASKFIANFDLLQGEVLKESLIKVEKSATSRVVAEMPEQGMAKEKKLTEKEPIPYEKETNRRS